jgi:hypothetical protein
VASWARREAEPRAPRRARCPDGLAPRGRVGSAPAARERAAATRHHARPRDDAASHPPLGPRHAPRVAPPAAAPEALTAWAQGGRSHRVDASDGRAHPRDARTGRPTPSPPGTARAWPLQAHGRPQEAARGPQTPAPAWVVSGTTSGASAWGAPAVSAAATRPSRGDGGVRWRTEPLVVVASVWVTTPGRRHGRLRVMPRAWLVSSVAHRRWRPPLAHHDPRVPHHSTHPPPSPP